MFYHSITEFVFLMNILGKRSDLPFSRKSDRKKEKSVVSFTHEQNIICSQTQLDNIAHEQTIICGQLFAGHVVASWPMKWRKICIEWLVDLAGLFSVEVYFQLFDLLAILLHFQLFLKACSTVTINKNYIVFFWNSKTLDAQNCTL